MRPLLLAAFLVTLVVAPAFAQQGQINGLITDSTGGVVPGVTVTATETATGGSTAIFTTPTDVAGNHKVVSISIWENREEAQKSAGMSATWVKENIADRVRLLTTQIGDLALFHGVPVAA